jgi:preprotein translocase subunit SecF
MILGLFYGTCSSLFLAAPLAYRVMYRKDKKAAAKA